MQQKEESFQCNKPCKNQDAPEFCEFFKINDLKAQLQAKTTLICNLKNQIKSVKEASNEAKVKHDIDVLKTINFELESSVAKLLAENEKLNKENEHLTQTYKELYDSIKKTRIQTKDHNDCILIASITPHYLLKVRECVLAKPHDVIAPGSSRNSQEESYGSNDMAHNHYLEEARKKTQERNRNSKPSVMHTTSLQNTTMKQQQTVEPKSHTQKLVGRFAIGQRFSPKKSSAVHEKPNTPRLVPQSPSPTPNVPPTKNDWDSLFCPMFDEYFNPSPSVVQPVLVAGVQEPVVSTGTPSSTRIDQDTPSTSTSQTTQEEQSHVIPTSVEEDNHVNQPQEHIEKWTKDHPLDKIIGDPSRPVSTRLQLQTEALFVYDALLSLLFKVGMQSMGGSLGNAANKAVANENKEELWCLLDHKIQQLSKGSSEGSGTTPEVPDEPKDNSAVVAEKQAGYVQTNLTLSSAELEIQSMVDVPIHQEDLAVQRTPLIDPVISMTFQEEFRSAGWCKENSDGQKTVAEDMGFNPLVHSFRALSTLRRSGLRTASAAAKPCQGDSSEVYLITGRILMVAAAGQKRVNSQPHAHTSYF
ncbi:hypothetical protein Tco_0269975 [Tanacetum coccineum]